MGQQEFLLKLSEVLEADPALTGAEVLSEMGTWDSLSVMSFRALAEAECGIVLELKEIGSCSTVNDLVALVCERNAAK